MLIHESDYFSHLEYSQKCAYEMHYFEEIPAPLGEATQLDLTLSDIEKVKFGLQAAFSEELEVSYPSPKGVDEQTKMFVDLEKEMGLPRPDSYRFSNATNANSMFCLSCYDWQNRYNLPNYGKKSVNNAVYYGSLFASLPCYGPEVKLYEIATTQNQSQTYFSPNQSKLSKNEWALCPSDAEAYFDFQYTGAVCFHASCVKTEIKLGPVAGLVSKFGLFKVKKNLFFEVEENGRWIVLDLNKKKLYSGDWGGWSYALAAYYGLL